MLVPLLVETYNETILNGGVSSGREDIFWNLAFWKHIAGTMNYTRTDFEWNEISFNKQQINQKQCIAISFPKPLKVPQAKYGLIVIDKEASYFTLEKSYRSSDWNVDGDDDFWCLGGVSNRKHVNYGFIEGVLTVLQFTEEVLHRFYGF